ncbi:MAG TPA: tRNA (adenosine(37)-N6)-threonylcarbamoyltransferase complex dimerization subunit type 1 TsaB [Flavobacterium sp.]|jgi:tRNA threonylcarbamoyladenosine biosynthesis protein TsaB|nr:tRNA (adenosine(37)-N6)-threonylcarbamoyltransferase complex dimerization subunit type 1 TsaB [Flavobacterium sp.]
MALILNIETATRNCSVTIARDGEILSSREIAEQGYSHAEKLHVYIEEVLQEANCTPADLSAIAVSQGPGSYTGLRIGVSAAKGLCYALEIPLITVDTLQVLASQVHVEDGVIVPMIDARRMEVYSAVFDVQLQKIREVRAEIITEYSLAEYNGNIYIIGDCQPKIQSVLNGSNFIYLDQHVFPSAKEMAPISFMKYQQQDFVDVAYFEPYYLKDFLILTKKV